MEYEYILTSDGELYHHGRKGMKWGVRRYQNEDGSLTAAGKKRYARDAREQGYNNQDSDGTYYKNAGKKGGRKDTLAVDAHRYVKEDMTRSKKALDESSQLANKLKNANDQSMRNASKNRTRMDLSKMSDKELRDRINRELLERQYNDVFNPPTVKKGRETAGKILETTGTVLGIASSAVGLALAIKELRG